MVYQKHWNSSADRAALARTTLRYKTWGSYDGKAGKGGRWDGYLDGDARDQYPARYCPRHCATVHLNVARCQCVTRQSLHNYYLSLKRGQGFYSWPQCCFLVVSGANNAGSSGGGGWGQWWGGTPCTNGNCGGGGSNGGPTPPAPTPTPQPPRPPSPPSPSPIKAQTLQLKLTTLGACSTAGQGTIESSMKGFLATLPGVVGSTVEVRRILVQGVGGSTVPQWAGAGVLRGWGHGG
jgi:hypothetical protein